MIIPRINPKDQYPKPCDKIYDQKLIGIGVDPSLRSTGLFLNAGNQWYSLHIPTKGLSRAKALDKIFQDIEYILVRWMEWPSWVAVEQYAFNAKGSSMSAVIEAGCLARYAFWCHGVSVVEVAPASWKKYMVGKGNATKQEVRKIIAEKDNLEFQTQDELDAFCIWSYANSLSEEERNEKLVR